MIIAVNTRLRKETQPEGYESFVFETLKRLTEKFSQHQFIFISDRPCDKGFIFAKNVTQIIARPGIKNSLQLQYWFNYKIPAVLRRHKADVFLSMEGICSIRTKKPQCLLLSDLCFIRHPLLLKKSQAGFYKKFTAAFLLKAKSIATLSAYSKSVLIDQYKLSTDDVDVITPGIDVIFKPLGLDEKEINKERYAVGKEYFLFSGNSNLHSNIINLLKAFSIFKQRQKSNMLLLIAGNPDESFTKDLNTFKYKNEVIVLADLSKEELAKITASAYALVYPVLYSDLALPPLQAMQCGVPVIAAYTGALRSICGNAALYVNPDDFKDIAENMMLVFKDEDKAKELVKAGKAISAKYHWDKTAGLLMQSILKAYNS